MLSISRAFALYLSEASPSLFYQAPLDCLSFRWKIPKQECLIGWTSPRSGIDVIAELGTDEVCGFAGIHFPGMQFLEYLANQRSAPYEPLFVVERLQQYLTKQKETLGQYYQKMRHEAIRTNRCYLKYATDEVAESIILTSEGLIELSRLKNKNLPRA